MVLAGIVSTIIGNNAHPDSIFTRTLTTAFDINISTLGIVTAAIQFDEADKALNAIKADPNSTQQQRDEAQRNANDKLGGLVATIGAAIASVPTPGTKALGGSIWLAATIWQQSANGNFEAVSEFVNSFAIETYGDIIEIFSNKDNAAEITTEENGSFFFKEDGITYEVGNDGDIVGMSIATLMEDGSSVIDFFDGDGEYLDSVYYPPSGTDPEEDLPYVPTSSYFSNPESNFLAHENISIEDSSIVANHLSLINSLGTNMATFSRDGSHLPYSTQSPRENILGII